MATVMNNTDICTRCAQKGATCCELRLGQEELCFPLSKVERLKIEKQMGKGVKAFVVEPNTPNFLKTLKKLFPERQAVLQRIFPKTGKHFRLATGAGGRCRLLGDRGCLLLRESRPFYCRLFPLWYGRGLYVFHSTSCLAQEYAKNRQELFYFFNTSLEEIQQLHSQLILAWGIVGPQRTKVCDR